MDTSSTSASPSKDKQRVNQKQEQVRQIQVEDSESVDDIDYAHLYMVKAKKKKITMVTIELCRTNVQIYVDSGTEVDIIDESTYKQLRTKPTLSKPKTVLTAYQSSDTVDVLGEFISRVFIEINQSKQHLWSRLAKVVIY